MSFISLLADNAGIVAHTIPMRLHRPSSGGLGVGAVRALPHPTRSMPTAPTPSMHSARCARPVELARDAGPLGTASAAGRWQWAGVGAPVIRISPTPESTVPATAVRMPPLLLEAMSAAARAQCRSLSEIWVEAAHEWLRQHAQEHEPQPPTPAAAALAVPCPSRSWAAIDTVLADLRRSPGTAA